MSEKRRRCSASGSVAGGGGAARRPQKSTPAPRSSTMRAVFGAAFTMPVSSSAMASVMALPASGRLMVTRKTPPSCSVRMFSLMGRSGWSVVAAASFPAPPPRPLFGLDLRPRLGAPQVPAALPGAGGDLPAAGRRDLAFVEIDDPAAGAGDQHGLHLQPGGQFEIDAAHD